MYAVLDDRNQQYRVEPGQRLQIHLQGTANEGDVLTFDKVCALGGEGEGRIGAPYVAGASVTAKVVRQVKGPKVIIGKFKRRKNQRRRTGFRAKYTEIEIVEIKG